LAVVLGLLAFAQDTQASAPDRAKRLASPSGAVVHVASEPELQQAIAALRSHTTIVLAPGTYRVTKTIAIEGVTDVVIRGATDAPQDVVLAGPGLQAAGEALAPGAFAIGGRRVTLANLTIRGFPEDAIVFGAGAAQPTVYHVRLIDSGRFVAADRPGGVDRGTIEFSTFEYSAASRADYPTGAIAVAGGRGWIVRNNVFRNIRPPDGGLAAPALSFSDGASSILIEGNTFVNAQQEIVVSGTNARAGAANRSADNFGAIVRNNFIARRAGLAGEAAITVTGVSRVVHNTVLLNGTHRTAIEFGGDAAGLQIANNLVDAAIEGGGSARAAVSSNATGATAALFKDAARGDLHLTARGAAALKQIAPRSDATSDWDEDARQGAATYPGADAYTAAPLASSSPTAAAPASGVPTTAVSSDAASQPSTLAAEATAVEALAATLPSPWQTTAIGNPSRQGDASYASSTWTIYGSGKDIWGSADQLRFVYRTLAGDGDVVARVADLEYGSKWSKAGVMIRESLNAGAREGSALVSRAGGIAFRYRQANGNITKSTTSVSGVVPVWLKISRRGSVVTAYRSTTGTSWTALGSVTISLPSTAYVGLAVTSNDTSKTAMATMTNVSVTGGGSSTNNSPSVSLTAPAAGATFTAPASITVSASASDTDGTIAQVQFYRNGTLIGTDTTAPYSVTWSSAPAGTYSITAVATDNDGATTTSAARSIVINTSGSSGSTRRAVFTPSADHASGVTRYQLDIFTAGANPGTATPIAGRDLGKPSIVGGECSVDVTTTINALPAGTYQATVSAIGPGGSSRSAAATFVR
jgi:hypothetical protein